MAKAAAWSEQSAREGRPAGYVERQVRGWGERYRKARTDTIPQVERVAACLEASRPAESGAAFLHGDYKYDNLVLDPADPARIHGILGWEMSTVGDPLMDLGTTLGYWLDPSDPPEHRQLPFGPTLLEGNLTRAELVERYAARTGRDCSNVVFHYVFGLFKIAVIAQQIYKRFHEGKTDDPRFAAMIQGVLRVRVALALRGGAPGPPGLPRDQRQRAIRSLESRRPGRRQVVMNQALERVAREGSRTVPGPVRARERGCHAVSRLWRRGRGKRSGWDAVAASSPCLPGRERRAR